MANTLFSTNRKPKKSIGTPQESTDLNRLHRPWKILLIDDDHDVITVSKMALNGLKFQDNPIKILCAASATEAKIVLKSHPDIALAIVDVVMENDQAGLDLIHWIREEQQNPHIRLVLRTGQPGQAPEEEVIHKYEINDYKHKTELSAIRLKTTVLSALRSYRDIKSIANNQTRLEQILTSTNVVLKHSEIDGFLSSAQQELKSLVKQPSLSLGIKLHCFMPYAESFQQEYYVCDQLGFSDNPATSDMTSAIEALEREKSNSSSRSFIYRSSHEFTHYVKTNEFVEITVYIRFSEEISPNLSRLLPHFTSGLAVSFDNLTAKNEVEDAQQQLMMMLSEAIETRSKETGAHVLRVALICEFIAQKLGLSKKHIEVIKNAAPMHDLGKIGVPESILHKPGALDEQEWAIMKEHPIIGHKLLSKLKHGLPRMGAMVSLSHHEKWDGSGYPYGISGEDIPIEGRIMAIADVIDALGSKRSYKKAWSDDKIVDLIREQSGRHFDPDIASIAIEHFAEIMVIRQQHPDQE